MIRNQHPLTLMIFAAAASYLLGLATTVGLEQFGLHGFYVAYVAGFVLTGITLAISWLLVRWSILLPLHQVLATIDTREVLHSDTTLQQHKVVGPLIDKVLKVTRSLVQTLVGVNSIVQENSIALAETSHQADVLNSGMQVVVAKSADIADSSRTIATTSAQVSASASVAARSAQRAQEDSRTGQEALQQTIAAMRKMAAQTETASSSIGKLQSSSTKIEEIVRVIGEVADQINLLALNAAIEAARAGEHGRGFAVVADEVRALSTKTSAATKDIHDNVGQIRNETLHAVTTMSALLDDVQNGLSQVESVSQHLEGILKFSSTLAGEMQTIVEAAENSTHEVESISSHLEEMRHELGAFGTQMQSISEQSMQLCELGEGMHEQLADLELDTIHNRMFKVAHEAAGQVQQAFEQAIAAGLISEADLFDHNYHPLANTNPQKYSSRFDAIANQLLPPIQEAGLRDHPELMYAVCTDAQGYVPRHNDKYSEPLTGDYNTDLLRSRSNRLYTDRTAHRCCANTKKMLLQTYKRDTGEVTHDLSVPIYVDKRHWGTLRVGYTAS